MKLKCIIEKIGGSATPIRAIGDTFGVLIDLLYNNPKFKNTTAALLFKNFLNKPLPNNWKNIKNKVIDEVVPLILNDPDLKNDLGDDANNLAEFKNIQDDVVVSGLMDVEMKYLSITPLKAIAMNQNERNKAKLALGPTGFVALGANIAKIEPAKIKPMMKKLGEGGQMYAKEAKQAIPSAKPMEKF
jgi:hypothetical protein